MAAIGIDLGTTYSCVAVYKSGEVKIIPNDIGRNTTPSHVAIDEDGSALVGEAAKSRADIKAENTIFDVKRLIGRKFNDPIVLNDISYWPFKVINIKNTPIIQVRRKNYFPEQISAKVLSYLKGQAEDFLGEKVKDAVITVPAYFNDGQRQATKDAGEIAGLNVLRIINEPTAAAIAYNHQLKPEELQKILVFDLGGGTFDISVLEMQDNRMEVKAVGGDTHLGGEDFDNALVEYCLQEFKSQHGMDLKAGKASSDETERFRATKALRRLKNECEQQKVNLTAARRTIITLDAVYGDLSLSVPMTREKFNELNQDFFRKCIDVMDKTLEEAKIPKETIDEIVLVGGSSKIPCVQDMVTNYFNGKNLSKVIRADEAVAYGAALHASTMSRSVEPEYSFKDVYPLPIGVKVKLVDGRDFSTVMPRNSSIPGEKQKRYYTVQANQPAVKVTIYEGEELLCANNLCLGEFELNLPANTPKDEPFDVCMSLDEDGILHVKAQVPKNKAQKELVVMETKGRLTPAEIDKFKMEELEFYGTFSSGSVEF